MNLSKAPYLEEVDVPVCVAETENVLLFGVLGNGLHDAVLGQQGVARRQLLLWGAFTVGLVEQQGTTWRENMFKRMRMYRRYKTQSRYFASFCHQEGVKNVLVQNI